MAHIDAGQPLVSCIMPTYNRREFVPYAIHYFLRQDYANKELIIIDDGTDVINDLVPKDERIRYFRLKEKLTLGAKLNMACERARGTIIAHWDDDDWYAARRLIYQVETLLQNGTALCGINKLLYYDLRTGKAYQYIYPPDQRLWLLGSVLCYKKELWEGNRFREIDVGMDGLFVWATPPELITVLRNSTFAVFMIHEDNISPKKTHGRWWNPYPAEKIQRLLMSDWTLYKPKQLKNTINLHPRVIESEDQIATSAKLVRNIFVCLVHENQECIIDLVRNLRYYDPSSVILLYDGGKDPQLLHDHFPFEKYGVVLHPSPRPMVWGYLHTFAIECMQFVLNNFSFDILTIVDSDQLKVRSGYSEYIGQFLSGMTDVGMLGNSPDPLPSKTNIAPAVQAWKEIDLWRPFLKCFSQGEEKFVHWTFWPSTVFTMEAVRDLTKFFTSNKQLQYIIEKTKIWATEEVIIPTLTALLGYKIFKNPCSDDYVKYRAQYTISDIDSAFKKKDVFWIHPIPRRYDNALRTHIRSKSNQYELMFTSTHSETMSNMNSDPWLLLTVPILKAMNEVKGWLEEEEADLLIEASRIAVERLPKPHAVVEIGSYCGRSTIVLGSVVRTVCPKSKVYAIDPHDGKIGALDQGILTVQPSLEMLKCNIENADLVNVVEIIQRQSVNVSWDKPISFLFIDGLHDYPNVARDFWHFSKWVRSGGFIAFHDYSDYYPGVRTFVNELLTHNEYQFIKRAKSLVIFKKK